VKIHLDRAFLQIMVIRAAIFDIGGEKQSSELLPSGFK
jgi:hypothetical protein